MRIHPIFTAVRRVALLTAVVAVCGAAQADTTTQGFLIPNAWFDDTTSGDPLDPPDGVNWSFNSPWFHEPNVFSGTALFITSASNQPGFYAAEASPRDIAAQADVMALDGFDPSTTMLTNIIFSDPWRVGHFGTVPTTGEYNYFIEYTLETPSGFYRAASQKLDRETAFQNTIVQTDFEFTWEGGGFLGDPFLGGNGIALDQILSQTYNVLIEVITPTSDLDGFFNVEGFNVEYVVSSAVAAGLQGDFNDNGIVDAADYTIWRDHEGLAESLLPSGTGDGSGTIDAGDYNLWVTNFGQSSSSAANAVPEPSSACLIVTLLVGAVVRRRACWSVR